MTIAMMDQGRGRKLIIPLGMRMHMYVTMSPVLYYINARATITLVREA